MKSQVQHQSGQDLMYGESRETHVSSESTVAGSVKGLAYRTIPLSELPEEQAIKLIKDLYSPEERFSQGFFKYRRDILKLPEEEAWQTTMDEIGDYIAKITSNLSDPNMHSIGFDQQGVYVPVGIYGFRELDDHPQGKKLLPVIEKIGLSDRIHGRMALAHNLCTLSGHRNRIMLLYSFFLIALQALEQDFKHIFFFMSDHRLKRIYRRFGLEFPEGLEFPDSKRLVGCYHVMDQDNMEEIRRTGERFGVEVSF